MSHEMLRKERELSEAEAYRILGQAGDGVLATMGEDGYPYAVPMNHVLADGALYLHSALTGHKLDNLAFCDKVSYCVVTEREVVAGYPDRILPRDEAAAKALKARTLTNLYNERPAWLAMAHARLDAAVAAAYGWPADLPDEDVLERLFQLNQERAAAQAA